LLAIVLIFSRDITTYGAVKLTSGLRNVR
jgi:hypothetical protein